MRYDSSKPSGTRLGFRAEADSLSIIRLVDQYRGLLSQLCTRFMLKRFGTRC